MSNLGNQVVAASVTYPDELALNKNAYGEGVAVQAHHLIPTEVAEDYGNFFQDIANHSGGSFVCVQDNPSNGVFLPDDPLAGSAGPSQYQVTICMRT